MAYNLYLFPPKVLRIYKVITSLETASIERVKIYGKCLGEEFPAWNQEFELAGHLRLHLCLINPKYLESDFDN